MTHPRKQRILNIFGREPKNLDELARCVIACTETKTKKVLGLAWDVKYSQVVSNTHSCPLDGVQNWHGKNELPRGYPGWAGRVWVRLNNDRDWQIGDSLTYTGTGGSGGYDGPWEKLASMYFHTYGHREPTKSIIPRPCIYSWDYRFYLADWPGIANEIEEQRTVAALKGIKLDNRHQFHWEDPDQVAQDQLFIQDFERRQQEGINKASVA